MPRKHKRLIEMIQVTRGGELLTVKHRKDAPSVTGVAEFSHNWKLCYFQGKVYRKTPPGWGGGTHCCEGNQYIIMQKGSVE